MASEDVSINADVTEVTLPTVDLQIPIGLRDFGILMTSKHGPISRTYKDNPIDKTYTDEPIAMTSQINPIAMTGKVGDN